MTRFKENVQISRFFLGTDHCYCIRTKSVIIYSIVIIMIIFIVSDIITQGPKDVVLPVSAQARFTCTANSSLNVTKIGWLAITTAINGNPLTLTSNEQLSSVGINLIPSGSKFISEISVEGVAKNNGTLLSCRVTINGSVVPNAQSTNAKLILYGMACMLIYIQQLFITKNHCMHA